MAANNPDSSSTFPKLTASDVDAIFYALKFPMRRNLLVALATGGSQTSDELKDTGPYLRKYSNPGKRLDSTGQHLKVLVDAGLVVQDVDPRDRRRPLYTIAPNIKVSRMDGETVFDLGSIVVRLEAPAH